MELKNFLTCLIFLLDLIINSESDLEEYGKLKIENVPSIKRDDSPDEFGDGAYKTVDEFVRKTRNLEYEIVLYFDYTTGEILKCVKGGKDNVRFDFVEGEFDGCRVASIHNHPKSVYSPPSDKNFGILARDFEDYELVASVNEFWILKAKGSYVYLLFEFKFMAELFLRASIEDAKLRFDDLNEINDNSEEEYGNQLLKYINDNDLKIYN